MTLTDSEADLPATPHYRPGTTDGETSKIVINELLAYFTYHMNNSSAETLKKVVLKFYHPDEIITASNVLSQECPTVAGSVVRHRNTPAREAHVAHAHDIIKALAKIDCSDEVFPLFVATKIDRIPRYSPEEIDLTSVVERLNDLERKFGVLDGTVAKHTDTMAAILDVQCATGYAATAKQGAVKSAWGPPPQDQRRGSLSVSALLPQPGPQQQVTVAAQGTVSVPGNQGADEQPTSDGAGGAVDNDSEGFVLPRDQIRRHHRRENNMNKKKVVYGKGDSSGLTASARTREIFVFNLSGDTSPDDLKLSLMT